MEVDKLLTVFWCKQIRHCCIFRVWINLAPCSMMPERCLILIEVIKLNLTCLTDPSAPCGCSVSRWLPGHTNQTLVTLAQIVPRAPTGLALHPGTDGAAATHARRHTTFTLELQSPPGGAVYLLAGWAVQSLEPLSLPGGPLLCTQHPQQGTQNEEHPHPRSACREVGTPALYRCV